VSGIPLVTARGVPSCGLVWSIWCERHNRLLVAGMMLSVSLDQRVTVRGYETGILGWEGRRVVGVGANGFLLGNH
jgi:hypothetical protein